MCRRRGTDLVDLGGRGGGNNPGPGQLEVKLISQKNEEWIRSDPIRCLCFMSDQCICSEKCRLSFSFPPISLIFNSNVCFSFLLIYVLFSVSFLLFYFALTKMQ